MHGMGRVQIGYRHGTCRVKVGEGFGVIFAAGTASGTCSSTCVKAALKSEAFSSTIVSS